jgi:3,4-dihydroxy 2-butanone 4-phosphate synthase / GTP cyclohydrolase II
MLENGFTPIPEALEALRQGRLIALVDDQNRENEGDIVAAAEFITPETINFMIVHGRGILCLAMAGAEVERLGLRALESTPRDSLRTAWHTPIDLRVGITTGTSAPDRAATIRAAADPKTQAADFVCGHVQTLRGVEGGVLVRAGHTEGTIDLMRIAGLRPLGVICEILKPNGEMARLPELREFAAAHGLPIVSVADIIGYRRLKERLISFEAGSALPTTFGKFTQFLYSSKFDALPHIAVVKGPLAPESLRGNTNGFPDPVLVRVHSECFTGDTLGSLRCDCREQLHAALASIEEEGLGVVLYIRQEGRGIGLLNKVKAYALQDKGLDTVEANEQLGFPPDLRHYGVGAQILYDLGLRKIRILTNNPKKIAGLAGYGLQIVEQIPLKVAPRPENERYLTTKRLRMGHEL